MDLLSSNLLELGLIPEYLLTLLLTYFSVI